MVADVMTRELPETVAVALPLRAVVSTPATSVRLATLEKSRAAKFCSAPSTLMSSFPALTALRGSTFATGPPVSLPAVASISAV